MAVNDDAWNLAFDRRGNYSLSLPDDMDEHDWDLPTRVVGAVRQVLNPDPPTLVLPMVPVAGVEDTQPISIWFTK